MSVHPIDRCICFLSSLPVLLLASCEPANRTEIIVEAPDYGPVGEAVKFLALAILGCVVVGCITSIINRDRS